MRTVAVVGGSLAGLRTVETLRKDGFDGVIHFIGEENHPPYDRPPLSKELLSGKLPAENIPLISDDDFAALDLELHLGVRAVGFDAAAKVVSLDTGEDIAADGVCLATGARPRQLKNSEFQGVHVLRTLEDSLALKAEFEAEPERPERVVVVGAGFIGAEVAATARGYGLDVTMVEMLEVPLSRVLGQKIGQVMAELHLSNGVDLRLEVGVERLTDSDGLIKSVILTDGTEIPADVVVVGIGVIPNTEWLANSGLTLDNGVVCDETLLAAPGVVAAGDVARWPNQRFGEMMRVEHWDNAIEQGIAAARRLMASPGQEQPFEPIPWFWSDQYDRKLQLAGIPSPQGQVEIVVGSLEERRFVALYEKDGKLSGVLGMNRPRHVMQYRQLIVDGASWQDALEFANQQG